VRTSQKRSLGQSSDGLTAAPVLPPDAWSLVTIYAPESEPRSRLRLVARGFLYAAVGLLIVVTGLTGGLYLFFHQAVVAIRAHSVDVKRAEKRLHLPLPGHAAIALLIGYDHRANQAASDPSRSDTIMLVRTDPQAGAISLLSLPRDLVTNVICPGQLTRFDRINSAYSECGSKGTVATVEALTSLPINYLVTVNFRGFRQIVDSIGGIWIDVDRRYYHSNSGLPQSDYYAQINLQPGYQRLNGTRALDFARYRHTDSDLFRVARQQEFVEALKQQISQSFSLLTLPQVIGAISNNVEVGVGGGGQIGDRTVLSYALFGYELQPGHFFQVQIHNLNQYGPYGAELVTDRSNIAAAVQQFTHPDVNASSQATRLALGLRQKPVSAPPPRATTISVFNGNGVPGDAARAGLLIARRGYRLIRPQTIANAPSFGYVGNEIYFQPTSAAEAAAHKLALVVGNASVGTRPPWLARRARHSMLVLVVGSAFNGSLPPPAPPPKPPAPQVTYEPGVTLSLLRPLRQEAGFQLMAPALLANGSSPDPAGPARVYAISGHHRAVRLVYQNGLTYWGIEETPWTGAPILAGRSFHHALGGRSYDLYYHGSSLYMVVLRADGATYWVMNSLLDSLSNETMLAIAKSLRPVTG
jgi:LCP family protein required for cell wall assembly